MTDPTARDAAVDARGRSVPATRRGADLPTRLLVLGMAHPDGTIVGAELYPVARACGLTTEQVRSCLRRLVAEGLFVRSGAGREATFSPTPAGRRLLSGQVARHRIAYLQDHVGRGWDGRWRLVAFAVPEQQRGARDAFRHRLRELGGAAVHNGLYVSPHPWERLVREAADRAGVSGHLVLATSEDLSVRGVTDPRELARILWRVDRLAERYRAFCDRYRDLPATLERLRRERHERIPDDRFYPGALRMGIEWQGVFDDDPLLPPELLPRPWPGREARDILARARRTAVRMREDPRSPALWAYLDEIIDRL